ncbi:class I tRNA ligase family protein, partial [Candidatus Uhrbacteria bacterium]|nr:class I tRNA ligase family protein [Candidatus Uhrbacteria bacterium]
DLDTVDYLEKIKTQQRHWIGKSEGASIKFEIDVSDKSEAPHVEVFTTRADTLDGATFIVLAPEHELVEQISTDDQSEAVRAYVNEAAKKNDRERGNAEREKTGVFTGAYAINPLNSEKIPVWIADYVLMGYGTGAIMAVPQHDERDRAFAETFSLPIEDRALVDVDEVLEKIGAKKTTTYKLRDWVFSRQRYWGEPIPLVHCDTCSSDTDGWVAVPEVQLPIVLPEVEKYEPTDDGESPLAAIEDWVNTECPSCGGPAKRETDTMPNWAGSSWYYLRYADAHNKDAFASKEKLEYWTPVDLYNGGMEHTTLHLLYSRFWHKFLFDQGHVPTPEPYARRHSHGLVLAEDGTKMSKSKGNVVNPDEIVAQYGADSLRMYILFMGPFEEPVPWSLNGLIGVRRFLDKAMRYVTDWKEVDENELAGVVERSLKKVSDDIEAFKFNTTISGFMSLFNDIGTEQLTRAQLKKLLIVLCPFAPHLVNEAWEMIGEKGLVDEEAWPTFDESLLVLETIEMGEQVNGKVRGSIVIAPGASEDVAREEAMKIESVQKHVDGKEIVNVIYKAGKILNLIAK